ncbi:NADAR family protein [Altericista sp. CCNU0014]|uniref:NADAR family protein n=1 Tax=Altericista sp. CCNU0014 TaxID=3082949 RepID=UPI00384F0A42
MTIFFYKVCEPYGCFSNFSPHSIWLGGTLWPTAEHYYQAQKFVGTVDRHLCQQICNAESPEMAAAIGRNPKHTVRCNWDTLKAAVMYDAVSTKFASHPDLAEVLLKTGQELIIEDSPTDSYWGCGADGLGQNQLGKVLMRVRQELQRNLTGKS